MGFAVIVLQSDVSDGWALHLSMTTGWDLCSGRVACWALQSPLVGQVTGCAPLFGSVFCHAFCWAGLPAIPHSWGAWVLEAVLHIWVGLLSQLTG